MTPVVISYSPLFTSSYRDEARYIVKYYADQMRVLSTLAFSLIITAFAIQLNRELIHHYLPHSHQSLNMFKSCFVKH